MQAQTHTPTAIFGNHIRYVVPMFQRPYVWTKEDQWQPLWEDLRAVAERLHDTASTGFGHPTVPPHFLGAIVLDQQMIPSGFIAARHVIDGQQRLTTLQLLLDAAQLVVQRHGAPRDAQALRVLVLNDQARLDPTSEDLSRLVIKAYTQAGNKPAVEAELRRLRVALQEIGEAPSPDTLSLVATQAGRGDHRWGSPMR